MRLCPFHVISFGDLPYREILWLSASSSSSSFDYTPKFECFRSRTSVLLLSSLSVCGKEWNQLNNHAHQEETRVPSDYNVMASFIFPQVCHFLLCSWSLREDIVVLVFLSFSFHLRCFWRPNVFVIGCTSLFICARGRFVFFILFIMWILLMSLIAVKRAAFFNIFLWFESTV